jgi:plastocyanin
LKAGTVVGGVVAVLIIGAVVSIGYYQTVIAPGLETGASTTQSSTTSCTSTTCISVSIPTNAGTTPPGYEPDVITVVLGVNNTVVWTNDDTTGTPHTVTSQGGTLQWGSTTLMQGDTFEFTFASAGTYHYYCTFHPTVMTGTVIVKSG